MKKLQFVFVLLVLVSLFISLDKLTSAEETAAEPLSYTPVDQTITVSEDVVFNGVAEGSSVTTDKNGAILTADMTATQDTIWNINGNEMSVSTGTHLTYENGIATIQSSDASAPTKAEITSGDTTSKIRSSDPAGVTYKDDTFYGKDFKVDDYNVAGRFGNEGGMQEVSEGNYLLSEGSSLSKEYFGDTYGLKSPLENDIFITDTLEGYQKLDGTSFFSDANSFYAKTAEGESLLVGSSFLSAELSDGASINYLANPSNDPTLLESLRTQQGLIAGRETGVSLQAIGNELDLTKTASGALAILPDDMPVSLRNGLGMSTNPFGGNFAVGQHYATAITGEAEIGATIEYANQQDTLAIRGEIFCGTSGEVGWQLGCAARF